MLYIQCYDYDFIRHLVCIIITELKERPKCQELINTSITYQHSNIYSHFNNLTFRNNILAFFVAMQTRSTSYLQGSRKSRVAQSLKFTCGDDIWFLSSTLPLGVAGRHCQPVAQKNIQFWLVSHFIFDLFTYVIVSPFVTFSDIMECTL